MEAVHKVILARTKEIFFSKLESKTNWGRNQIKKVYAEAVTEALMEALEK